MHNKGVEGMGVHSGGVWSRGAQLGVRGTGVHSGVGVYGVWVHNKR